MREFSVFRVLMLALLVALVCFPAIAEARGRLLDKITSRHLHRRLDRVDGRVTKGPLLKLRAEKRGACGNASRGQSACN